MTTLASIAAVEQMMVRAVCILALCPRAPTFPIINLG